MSPARFSYRRVREFKPTMILTANTGEIDSTYSGQIRGNFSCLEFSVFPLHDANPGILLPKPKLFTVVVETADGRLQYEQCDFNNRTAYPTFISWMEFTLACRSVSICTVKAMTETVFTEKRERKVIKVFSKNASDKVKFWTPKYIAYQLNFTFDRIHETIQNNVVYDVGTAGRLICRCEGLMGESPVIYGLQHISTVNCVNKSVLLPPLATNFMSLTVGVMFQPCIDNYPRDFVMEGTTVPVDAFKFRAHSLLFDECNLATSDFKASSTIIVNPMEEMHHKSVKFVITARSLPTISFPKNTPSVFTIALPPDWIHLGEHWRVRILSLVIPARFTFLSHPCVIFEAVTAVHDRDYSTNGVQIIEGELPFPVDALIRNELSNEISLTDYTAQANMINARLTFAAFRVDGQVRRYAVKKVTVVRDASQRQAVHCLQMPRYLAFFMGFSLSLNARNYDEYVSIVTVLTLNEQSIHLDRKQSETISKPPALTVGLNICSADGKAENGQNGFIHCSERAQFSLRNTAVYLPQSKYFSNVITPTRTLDIVIKHGTLPLPIKCFNLFGESILSLEFSARRKVKPSGFFPEILDGPVLINQ